MRYSTRLRRIVTRRRVDKTQQLIKLTLNELRDCAPEHKHIFRFQLSTLQRMALRELGWDLGEQDERG